MLSPVTPTTPFPPTLHRRSLLCLCVVRIIGAVLKGAHLRIRYSKDESGEQETDIDN